MKPNQIIMFTSDAELAQSVATAWLDEVAVSHKTERAHFVALSGGRITLKFFAAVIELSKARNISVNNVHFFWADERCVPPDHKESSYAAAAEHFFRPLAIARGNTHRIYGEQAPEFAARLANMEIKGTVPLNAAGQPVFDIVFLGMGEDGHVASLFPEEPEAARLNPAIYRVITNSPKPPPHRITLGYAAIAAAKNVWVLASGAGKEAVLRESLSSEGKTPLARVLQMSPAAKVFTDIKVTRFGEGIQD